jgi:hypothetical protein
MNSKKLGLVVFWIGAILMLVVGWLSSWWFVPTIKKLGFENIPVPGLVSFIWGLSAPLGATIVAIGAGLYAQVNWRRLLPMTLGVFISIFLLALLMPSQLIPALFGINGGLITLFFLGIFWNWAKTRPGLSKNVRTGSDLQMVGYLFFLIVAWYLCGLLGAPTFALRPELMQKYKTLPSAINLGSLISVCLAIGFAFIFFGHRVIRQNKFQK